MSALPSHSSIPDIETTEHGWAWTAANGDRHELNAYWGTVHVRTFFPSFDLIAILEDEDIGI